MAYKAVIHYPISPADQIALYEKLSSVKAEKMLKYLSSLELTGSAASQVVEEIAQRRYIIGQFAAGISTSKTTEYTPTQITGKRGL